MGALHSLKCPRGGDLQKFERNNPHLAPHRPHVGVVGHTIDRCITCSRRDLHNHPPLGLVSRVQVVVNQDGKYDFQVILFSKEKGSITTIDDYLALCEQIAGKGGYKFCPGIDPNTYKTTYYDIIRYDPKSLRRTMHPVQRIDSCKCILWHKLAKNASIFEKDMDAVMCPACKRLRNDLDQRLKKMRSTNLQQKENRVQPSSHFPEKYLSPKSLKKKRQNMQQERSKLLKKYSHMEVSLNEDQHDQMCNVMENVAQIGAKELESALAEGDKHGVGPAIRAIWKNDLQNIKKEFDQDQKQNSEFTQSSRSLSPSLFLFLSHSISPSLLYTMSYTDLSLVVLNLTTLPLPIFIVIIATGNRRNRWSMVTIRLALAVYTRSPAAYDALKSFGLIQLPSRATLQAYTGAFRDDAGECN